MKIINLLSGSKVLEETTSRYNGDIEVIRDFAWGTYIKAGGLTQSGGILFDVWNKTLQKLFKIKPQVKKTLILGLGGGSVAKLVHKNWPDAKITGVDIDSVMVDLGKKYLGLEKVLMEIKIRDAYKFVNGKYDLILVDLYNGHKIPQKFEEEKFLRNVKKMLNKDGVVIFNRLKKSIQFEKKLKKVFRKVDYFYPQANVELICYTQS